jgi:hypothetical protein
MATFVFTYRMPAGYVPAGPDTMAAWAARATPQGALQIWPGGQRCKGPKSESTGNDTGAHSLCA